MARWGKCEVKELERLNERLEQLSSVDFDTFCREVANEIAARLLAKVKKRTPVGVVPKFDEPKTVKVQGASGKSKTFLTRSGAIRDKYWSGYKGGTLRDAWTILPVEKHGDQYLVTVALANAVQISADDTQTGIFACSTRVRLESDSRKSGNHF